MGEALDFGTRSPPALSEFVSPTVLARPPTVKCKSSDRFPANVHRQPRNTSSAHPQSQRTSTIDHLRALATLEIAVSKQYHSTLRDAINEYPRTNVNVDERDCKQLCQIRRRWPPVRSRSHIGEEEEMTARMVEIENRGRILL